MRVLDVDVVRRHPDALGLRSPLQRPVAAPFCLLTLEVPEPEEGRVGRARVASYTVRLVRHRVPVRHFRWGKAC